MAKLIVIQNETRREVELTPLTTVGRHPGSTVQVTDEHVSKYHCQVVALDGGRFILRDLQSRNGTWMRGTRVGERELQNGDEFIVGNTMFKLVGAPAPNGSAGRSGAHRYVEETAKALVSHLSGAPTERGEDSSPGEDPLAIARRLEDGCQRLLVRFNELGGLVAVVSNRSSGVEARVRTFDETVARMGETLLQQERAARELWSQCGRLGEHLEAQEQRLQELGREQAELKRLVMSLLGNHETQRGMLASSTTAKLEQVREHGKAQLPALVK